jgi:hypothetical protein
MLGDCMAQLLDWTPGVLPAKKIARVYFSKRNYRKLGGTNFKSPKILEAPQTEFHFWIFENQIC